MHKTKNYESDIVLGEKYKDTQTGIEGVAVSTCFFQHGCERITIELLNHDGEIREYVFDAPRLMHVETQKVARKTDTGGPSKGPNMTRQVPRR